MVALAVVRCRLSQIRVFLGICTLFLEFRRVQLGFRTLKLGSARCFWSFPLFCTKVARPARKERGHARLPNLELIKLEL